MTSPLLNKEQFPILNERLREHCEDWKIQVPFLYHATKKENLASIFNKGLLTSHFGKVHGEISVAHNIPSVNIISIVDYETELSIDINEYKTINKKIDLALLHRFREHLVPKWKNKQMAMNQRQSLEDNSITEDKGMCRYSALFVAEALEEVTGNAWTIEGGDVWLPKHPTGGFKDSKGDWQGHYWTTDGNIIIDLAAKQFGDKEIVVAKDSDQRYCANYDESELNEHIKHVEDTVEDWLNEAREDGLFSSASNEIEMSP